MYGHVAVDTVRRALTALVITEKQGPVRGRLRPLRSAVFRGYDLQVLSEQQEGEDMVLFPLRF